MSERRVKRIVCRSLVTKNLRGGRGRRGRKERLFEKKGEREKREKGKKRKEEALGEEEREGDIPER